MTTRSTTWAFKYYSEHEGLEFKSQIRKDDMNGPIFLMKLMYSALRNGLIDSIRICLRNSDPYTVKKISSQMLGYQYGGTLSFLSLMGSVMSPDTF
jgi:hypothetical protein